MRNEKALAFSVREIGNWEKHAQSQKRAKVLKNGPLFAKILKKLRFLSYEMPKKYEH